MSPERTLEAPSSGWPGRSARRRARLLVVLAAVLWGAFLVAAPPADAHAQLESSTPADGSIVASAPPRVSLTFTEDVSSPNGGVRVFDDAGKRVDDGDVRASGRTVSVGLGSGLAKGTYVVTWRVISADSHPVHGGFLFSIGARSDVADSTVAGLFDEGGDKPYQVVWAALRIAAYLGALLASGAVLFCAWAAADDPDDPPIPGGLAVAGAGLGILASFAALPAQAALATGLGWSSVTEPGVLRQVLGEGVGPAFGVTVLALAVLLAVALVPLRGAVRQIGIVAALAAAAGFALTGHTRSMSPAAVGYVADLAHLVAAAVWFGGIAVLVRVVRTARRDPTSVGATRAATAVARFSSLMAWSLGALVVAGVAVGWIEVGSLHALTTTTYGRLLVVKVLVVAAVAAGGAYNRARLVPLLATSGGAPEPDAVAAGGVDLTDPVAPEAEADRVGPDPSPRAAAWDRLGRIIRVELALLVVVLGLTGVLVNVTPAKDSAGGGVYSATEPLGKDRSVNLVVDPARAGRNAIHVYLLDQVGRTIDDAQGVTFELSLPAKDIGPIDRQPSKTGPGHYQLLGDDLTLPGTWEVAVQVRLSKFELRTAEFTFTVRR